MTENSYEVKVHHIANSDIPQSGLKLTSLCGYIDYFPTVIPVAWWVSYAEHPAFDYSESTMCETCLAHEKAQLALLASMKKDT